MGIWPNFFFKGWEGKSFTRAIKSFYWERLNIFFSVGRAIWDNGGNLWYFPEWSNSRSLSISLPDFPVFIIRKGNVSWQLFWEISLFNPKFHKEKNKVCNFNDRKGKNRGIIHNFGEKPHKVAAITVGKAGGLEVVCQRILELIKNSVRTCEIRMINSDIC